MVYLHIHPVYRGESHRNGPFKMLIIVSLIGMAIVAVVLSLGIMNMAKGGTASRSQKLMRLRIAMQFLAVVCVMAVLYFTAS